MPETTVTSGKPLWMRARVIKKLDAVLYECLEAELGVIKRRSHQLLKYPFDDYEEDTKSTTNVASKRAI